METAGIPMAGYHYIAPNHIVKAPLHWGILSSQQLDIFVFIIILRLFIITFHQHTHGGQ